MRLHDLRPPAGAKKDRKRIGRGNASGQGTYAGKGMKGAQARSGPNMGAGFEGGQWPLIRKIARRGFTSPNRVDYEEVKLVDLGRFSAGSEVGLDQLRAAGLVKRNLPVKVLSNGKLDHALTVTAHKFTAAAKAKIEAAGGTVVQLHPAKETAEPEA